MGKRRNRRKIFKGLDEIQELLDREDSRRLYFGKCAYCGRNLGTADWHWMWDEFGQRVKKCNNERACYNRRSEIAEKAFRRAVGGK